MRHTPDRRQTLQYLGAALAAMGLPVQLAQAQSGTVKFILPNATGSGVDAITRTMAPVFGRLMGVNVVVENQAGASGVIGDWDYDHPIFDQAAIGAQAQLDAIQGVERLWFCGAWGGYGFHEDGLNSALAVANRLDCRAPWQDAPARIESAA